MDEFCEKPEQIDGNAPSAEQNIPTMIFTDSMAQMLMTMTVTTEPYKMITENGSISTGHLYVVLSSYTLSTYFNAKPLR